MVAVSPESMIDAARNHSAVVGEHDAAADPLEQRRADRAFELADPAADRGLGPVQPPGRLGEPARPGDAHEGLELVERHGHQYS